MRFILMSLLLVLVAGHVDAGTPPTASGLESPERPWAKGIPAAQQKLALEEFRKGNERFATSDYSASVQFYRNGIAFWDHPALHGNLAVALIRLQRPLEAFRHIQLALRWNDAPLETHVYEQLVTSERLLESQLARVSVICREATGASVTLDGVVFTECPMNHEEYTLAGTHDLVARKVGYLTMVKHFTAAPGQVSNIDVSLVPLTAAATYERRYAVWKPWAAAGTGAGLMLFGLGLSLKANSTIDNYDSEVDRLCPNGCSQDEIPQTVAALKSQASTEDTLAIGAFVLGGVGLVAGATLLYLNQPQRVEVDADGKRISVRPHLSPNALGLSASLTF